MKGADRMAVSGLYFENSLVGSKWATAVLLCTNGLRKQSSCPARRPFPTGKHLSQFGRAVAGWVWFESQMCRGWLQEHLCGVLGLKTRQNWGYGKFNSCLSFYHFNHLCFLVVSSPWWGIKKGLFMHVTLASFPGRRRNGLATSASSN